MLEVVVVLMIAGVLLGITVPQIGAYQSRRAVANARDGFIFLAARARAMALETGEITCIRVDRASGRIDVVLESGGAALDELDVADRFAVTIATSSGLDTKICYSSRGLAVPAMTNVPEAGNDTVTFSRGAEAAPALARPLGQVEAP